MLRLNATSARPSGNRAATAHKPGGNGTRSMTWRMTCIPFYRNIIYPLLSHSWLFYGPSRMPEMTPRALFSSSHHIHTPFAKHSEARPGVLFVYFPALLDERLQLSKEFFNKIQVGQVLRQVQQLDACRLAYLLDPLASMIRRVVHD
jgi:hypothetical protein